MTETEAQRNDAIVFELCAETLENCRVARSGGAARIEFCANLAVDGLTPDPAHTRAAVSESGLPVYMLLRPRAGDFVYTDAEFAVMRQDLLLARSLGVSGFALGVLLPDGRVDLARTRELVELAGPLEVTFHRAFDATPDLHAALEDVIATGCRRVLTSGGAPDAVTGAATLAALVHQAADRLEIAAGGGVRADNARALAELTGAHHFHGSLRYASIRAAARASLREPATELARERPRAPSSATSSSSPSVPAAPDASHDDDVDPRSIRQLVDELRLGAAARPGHGHAAQPPLHTS